MGSESSSSSSPPRNLLYLTTGSVVFVLISICAFSSLSNRTSWVPPPQSQVTLQIPACNYTDGEWVQGRTDEEYLAWRWQPNDCRLPRFHPPTFFDLMQNKHVAFVGDYAARNQFESLFCMLSKSSEPEHVYGSEKASGRWRFPDHNLVFSFYYSPFLVKGDEKNRINRNNRIFLDEIDAAWTAELKDVDVLLLSAGHSFLYPSEYYQQNKLLGCHALETCNNNNITVHYAMGRALETAFGEVVKSRKKWYGHSGRDLSVFFTTFSPDHYEGDFDGIGVCQRTQPYNRTYNALGGMNAEMRRTQMEKVEEARKRSGGAVSVEALDITELAWLRPDGHPGPFFYYIPSPEELSEKIKNECVKWCLPGPVDTWNEILLDVMTNRNGRRSQLRINLQD
ncbi:hypothetical protein M569_07424 [Genlisea aurea]|uniref:Trichome birefringence-like C-terminal domain-containing protein n=1 Tax=Genlisea aurea TaxID=192259 RepID=S8CR97_9LAMI|nr:hypothetical protein M569_07424 [Genlisea aurea]